MDDLAGPVNGTGIYFSADRAREERLKPHVDGGHVWTAMAVFRLADDDAPKAAAGVRVDLDHENLAMLQVGCFACEELWSERLRYRRCKGEPKRADR